jgi:hypothetical protein
MNRLCRRTLLLSGLVLVTTAANPQCEPGAGSGSVIHTWNQLAIESVRLRSGTDAQAARTYALVNLAMYDAVWGVLSHSPNRRTHALLKFDDAPARADLAVAAASAARTVLAGLHPEQAARWDRQLLADLAQADGRVSEVSAGQRWGKDVGARVLALRASDVGPAETQPAGTGPGQFRAGWSGTQFRALAPFGIADPSAFAGAGPPALGSLDYAAAFAEVKLLGNAGIPDARKLEQFAFWNLGAGTGQPPGAWLQIAMIVTRDDPLPLPETARLFALLAMAMADTVAPTYQTKFAHRAWRPTSAIREASAGTNPQDSAAGDTVWAARAGSVGGSPEYWSGHSAFSGAAATVLARFFCNDAVAFQFASDSAPGGKPRSYARFSDAERDAGRSRIVGGLHFEFSNLDGLAAGRAVAEEILAHKLLRPVAVTHVGHCPL